MRNAAIMLVILLILSGGMVRAAGPATAPSAERTAVMEATKQFGLAMAAEPEALRSRIAGRNAAEDHAADVFASSYAAQQRMSRLIREKLGAEVFQQHYGREARPRPTVEQVRERMDAMTAEANVEIAGDAARVTFPGMDPREAAWLIRRDGQWKVWIAAVIKARDEDLIRNYVRSNWQYGTLYGRLADQIEAGKLKTSDAINQAMGQIDMELTDAADPSSRPVTIKVDDVDKLKLDQGELLTREKRRRELERKAATTPLSEQKLSP